MFDDLEKKDSQIFKKTESNNNQSQGEKKVDDIFSDTDALKPQPLETEKPEVFMPKNSQGEMSNDISSSNGSNKKIKRLGIFIAMIIGALLVIYGGFLLISNLTPTIPEPVAEEPYEDENVIEEVADNIITDINIPVEPVIKEPVQAIDSDQDGLTDEKEKELGTDINSVDSDQDGLFDREEVMVYKTDPLNSDSDNDGYLDGAEVKNGYNPAGPGKLYEVN